MQACQFSSCPHCGSSDLRWSRRRGIELFAPLFGMFSLRCRDCSAIHFAVSPPAPVSASKSLTKAGSLCMLRGGGG